MNHLLDIVVREAARGLDADLLFLARGLVLSRHINDAVGVDVEGNFNLRHATRTWGNTDQVELTENLVVGGHFTLTLEDPDGHRRLVIFGGRKGL